MVQHASSPESWVEIQVRPSLKRSADGMDLVHFQFRMVCPGEGLHPNLFKICSASLDGQLKKGLH